MYLFYIYIIVLYLHSLHVDRGHTNINIYDDIYSVTKSQVINNNKPLEVQGIFYFKAAIIK